MITLIGQQKHLWIYIFERVPRVDSLRWKHGARVCGRGRVPGCQARKLHTYGSIVAHVQSRWR